MEIITGYRNDTVWKETQPFLPIHNRLSEKIMPEEYYIAVHDMKIHVDHYKPEHPKATVILFHGVGGNGRLLSFIAVPLRKNGYEVICPDFPLYGYTEYHQTITYDIWVACARDIVAFYQSQGRKNIFLFGLSAGGMLAYQAANECRDIKGIIATCILDQRNSYITRKTAATPLMGAAAKPLCTALNKISGKIKVPMKAVANMKAIANNKELVTLLMKDKKSSGVWVPAAFIHSMIHPVIKTEPEQFRSCPFLLVHPGSDKWTDVSLSRIFFDRLGCRKEIYILDGAGHFPVEEEGLAQLEKYCLHFLENNTGAFFADNEMAF